MYHEKIDQLLQTITQEAWGKYTAEIETNAQLKIKSNWQSEPVLKTLKIGDIEEYCITRLAKLYTALKEGFIVMEIGGKIEITEKGDAAISTHHAALKAAKETLFKIPLTNSSTFQTLKRKGYTAFGHPNYPEFYFKDNTYYSARISDSRANQVNIIIKRKHIIKPRQERIEAFKKEFPQFFRRERIDGLLKGI
ncbi:hypothetical protein GCM10027189_24910 [Rufibacter soli]